MPISSGAGGRTAPASKRAIANRRTNLKRSPNWPNDVTQSSPALAAAGGDHNQNSNLNANAKSSSNLSQNSFARAQDRSEESGATVGVQKQLKKSNSTAQQDDYKQQSISVIDGAREQPAINQAGAAAAQVNRLKRLMNSLGGQRVVTGGGGGGGGEATTSFAIDSAAANTMSGAGQSKKQAGLFTSLMLGGGGGATVDTNPHAGEGATSTTSIVATGDYKKPRMLGGKTYMISNGGGGKATASAYHLAGQQSTPSLAASVSKSSLQNSQASLLNPSMSLLSGPASAANTSAHANRSQSGAVAASATSGSLAAANLHNLHNHHNHKHHHHHHNHQRAPPNALNISKRVNLKYVKSLIVLLMSLDLLITIFVHHFASNDQLAIAFTSHKLRFSLLNLILSAVWFVVLAGAIIFDVYPILLLGCLVDFVSFLLLLVCSLIHFTHRIDYNTVQLTSLLLLLFSIIVLHVYLLVIAALTTYLMLAVKRRRKTLQS